MFKLLPRLCRIWEHAQKFDLLKESRWLHCRGPAHHFIRVWQLPEWKWSSNEVSHPSPIASAVGPTESPSSPGVCRPADKPGYRWTSSYSHFHIWSHQSMKWCLTASNEGRHCCWSALKHRTSLPRQDGRFGDLSESECGAAAITLISPEKKSLFIRESSPRTRATTDELCQIWEWARTRDLAVLWRVQMQMCG